MAKKILLSAFFLFFVAGSVNAYLPSGTISVITNAVSTATTTLLVSNSTTTIVSFYINHAFNSETDFLSCGNTIILTYKVSVGNYQSFPFLEFIKTCNQNINYKNGSDNNDTIILNYLPYDIYRATATTTAPATSTYTPANLELIATGTNSFYLDKSISYADFFIMLFLVLIVGFFIFDFLYRFIFRIKVNFRNE